MIDIAQIQGQVHAQSVQKVGELADKNPREAVSIIPPVDERDPGSLTDHADRTDARESRR